MCSYWLIIKVMERYKINHYVCKQPSTISSYVSSGDLLLHGMKYRYKIFDEWLNLSNISLLIFFFNTVLFPMYPTTKILRTHKNH